MPPRRQNRANNRDNNNDNNNPEPTMAQILQILAQQTANLTQQQERQANPQVTFKNFQSVNPPEFKGSADPIEARIWLKEIEKAFMLVKVRDEQKTEFASYYLKEEATYWWESVRAMEGTEDVTWDRFKELFLEKYFPQFLQDRMELQFLELKQGDMSVAEYEKKFAELARFVPTYVDTDRKRAKRFQQGLKAWIRGKLAILELDTYACYVKLEMSLILGFSLLLITSQKLSNFLSADLPSENDTVGYIFIHAEGGLNQQRIAICNAVAVAKILNATLILPVLKQDQIWKDQTKFEDIFDVDHFIEYLKNDVRIVRDIPEWFTDKAELFTNIRRTVKNIPKYAPAQFYIDNVLPRIKEKKIMSLKPFVDRLGYDNVPPEINKLRCRVNYHALQFLPEIEHMADQLVSRMRNRTNSTNPFMALHLRFEKGMVGLSFCDFVATRLEKVLMAMYRMKEWPRRFKDGSHLWSLALQKRKEGRCPLEPGEVAVMLRAMGYTKETHIYVASGQVYGGQNRMAPLRNMFPNLVTKEELAGKEELDGFRKHVTSLAALDFLVCLKSDVFVMTHGGNFAKLIIGARRYMGHRQKSIKPDKGLLSKSLGDPYMGWATFVEDVIVTHQTRTGLPEETFPNYDIWENPLTPCMCRT
nr:PREDICTED: uncharacterized protein At1g04910-like [Daucus carota subsp. sativus]